LHLTSSSQLLKCSQSRAFLASQLVAPIIQLSMGM
jgi:hypothetical protein